MFHFFQEFDPETQGKTKEENKVHEIQKCRCKCCVNISPMNQC